MFSALPAPAPSPYALSRMIISVSIGGCVAVLCASLFVATALYWDIKHLSAEVHAELSHFTDITNDAWKGIVEMRRGHEYSEIDGDDLHVRTRRHYDEGEEQEAVEGHDQAEKLAKVLTGNDDYLGLYQGEEQTPGPKVATTATTSDPKTTRCNCAHQQLDPKCPSGLPGPPGEPGEPGDDGLPGMAGTAAAPARIVESDMYIMDGCMQCPAGPPGPAGMEGRVGPPGPDGQPGQPGKAGESGRPGAPGPAGDPGTAGHPGEPGMPGPPGRGGVQRGASLPGPKGPSGPPGPAGSRGEPGRTPPAGQLGRPGPPGPMGPPGSNGKPGSVGDQGKGGEPGTDAAYCPCPPRTGEVAPQKSEPKSAGNFRMRRFH